MTSHYPHPQHISKEKNLLLFLYILSRVRIHASVYTCKRHKAGCRLCEYVCIRFVLEFNSEESATSPLQGVVNGEVTGRNLCICVVFQFTKTQKKEDINMRKRSSVNIRSLNHQVISIIRLSLNEHFQCFPFLIKIIYMKCDYFPFFPTFVFFKSLII